MATALEKRLQVHYALNQAIVAGNLKRDIAEKAGLDPSQISKFISADSLGDENVERLGRALSSLGFSPTDQPVGILRDSVSPYSSSLGGSTIAPEGKSPNGSRRHPYLGLSTMMLRGKPFVELTGECGYCGESVPGPQVGAYFCLVCGHSLVESCQSCGHANPVGQDICGNCGKRAAKGGK